MDKICTAKFFARIFLLLLFTIPFTPAYAATDAALVGYWEYSDMVVVQGVEYKTLYAVTFYADGTAFEENTFGGMTTREAATWEADGRFLLMELLNKPELEGADMAYEYSVQGDKLLLRHTYEDETMTLIRRSGMGNP